MKTFSRLYFMAFILAQVLFYLLVDNRDDNFHVFITALFYMASATIFGVAISVMALLAQGAPYGRFAYSTLGQSLVYVAANMTCVMGLYFKIGVEEELGSYPYVCVALWFAAVVAFVLQLLRNRPESVNN